jgi:hypothetical protein
MFALRSDRVLDNSLKSFVARDEDIDQHILFIDYPDESLQGERCSLESPRGSRLEIPGIFKHCADVIEVLRVDKEIDVLRETRLRMECHGDSSDKGILYSISLKKSDEPGKFVDDIHRFASDVEVTGRFLNRKYTHNLHPRIRKKTHGEQPQAA